MLRLSRINRWLRSLFRRNQTEQELRDELQFHVAMETASLEKQGLSAQTAHTEALRHFGGVERYAEDCRDERGTRVLETAMQDFRYALRMVRRFPGFTATVIVTLALAVGANTAMFTVINATLLQTLPFTDPGKVVSLYSMNADRSEPRFSVSYADWLDWRRDARAFVDMAVFNTSSMTMAAEGENDPERILGLVVSNNFFRVLGISAALGRVYGESDTEAEAGQLVLLTDRFWKRRFAGDSSVIGREVPFGGRNRQVIGVLPPDFSIIGNSIDAVTVLSPSSIPNVGNHAQHMLQGVARLKPGITLEQAQQDLASVAAKLAATHKDISGWSASVFGFRDEMVRGTRQPLMILFAAAALVLFIGCINVAGLLIARGTSRVREFSLRRALGASRSRVISQLLMESAVLAFAGGALGVAVSIAGTRMLLKLGFVGAVLQADLIQTNGRVLLFTFVLALITTIAVGLWPAFRSTRASLSGSLRESGRTSTGASSSTRARRSLVVAEISLALVLLLCSGLVVQSLQRTLKVNPGFVADRVMTMRLSLNPASYPDSTQMPFFREFLTRLAEQPGIEAAGAANTPPISVGGITTPLRIMSRSGTANEKVMHAVTAVTPGYFNTMHIQVVRGRDMAWSDPVATLMVSETAARRLWPGEDPIGKRIAFGNRDTLGLEVIGVVNDTKVRGLRDESTPMIYLAYQGALNVARTLSVVVRGRGESNAVVATTRRVLREMDRSVPVYNVQSVQDVIDNSIAQPRLNSTLLIVFAGLALLLAAIGIYGVVSYSVTQRTQELGVRMALGAARGDVFRLILREGAVLAVIGVALGIGGAVMVTPLIQGWLFGIGRGDPATFFAATVGLTLVALGASWIPARKATRVDPLLAMRGE